MCEHCEERDVTVVTEDGMRLCQPCWDEMQEAWRVHRERVRQDVEDGEVMLTQQEQAPSAQVTAPFTPEQVQSLNDYQFSGFMHPFTCPLEHVYRWVVGESCEPFDRDDLYDLMEPSGHLPDAAVRFGHVLLVATKAGWRCPGELCDYTQEWAHASMADRSWEQAQQDIHRWV